MIKRKKISWPYVKRVLRARREARDLAAAGFRRHETDWEIIRGEQMDKVIVDVRISACGKYVWTKLGPPSTDQMHPGI